MMTSRKGRRTPPGRERPCGLLTHARTRRRGGPAPVVRNPAPSTHGGGAAPLAPPRSCSGLPRLPAHAGGLLHMRAPGARPPAQPPGSVRRGPLRVKRLDAALHPASVRPGPSPPRGARRARPAAPGAAAPRRARARGRRAGTRRPRPTREGFRAADGPAEAQPATLLPAVALTPVGSDPDPAPRGRAAGSWVTAQGPRPGAAGTGRPAGLRLTGQASAIEDAPTSHPS